MPACARPVPPSTGTAHSVLRVSFDRLDVEGRDELLLGGGKRPVRKYARASASRTGSSRARAGEPAPSAITAAWALPSRAGACPRRMRCMRRSGLMPSWVSPLGECGGVAARGRGFPACLWYNRKAFPNVSNPEDSGEHQRGRLLALRRGSGTGAHPPRSRHSSLHLRRHRRRPARDARGHGRAQLRPLILPRRDDRG